jgi:hypothetical protein
LLLIFAAAAGDFAAAVAPHRLLLLHLDLLLHHVARWKQVDFAQTAQHNWI